MNISNLFESRRGAGALSYEPSVKVCPHIDRVKLCMEENEQYRKYLESNNSRLKIKPVDYKYMSPNDQLRVSMLSYESTKNAYSPTVEINAFKACTKELIDKHQ